MTVPFNTQLDAIVQSIYKLRDQLHSNPPHNGSAKQVDLVLLGALDHMKLVRQTCSWPVPTTERPDDETLEDRLFGDGACEATDSCLVEPDGVCPHGHPSWLRKLDLI